MSKYTSYEAFCKNVKKIRETHRLSKQEMAKRLHVGIKSRTSIECGIIPPRLGSSIIIVIYEMFGIMPSELFEQ